MSDTCLVNHDIVTCQPSKHRSARTRTIDNSHRHDSPFHLWPDVLQFCQQAAPESVLARYEELAALDARSERGRLDAGLAQVRASMLR